MSKQINPSQTIDPVYMATLRKLDNQLKGSNVNWVVTGSLAFALQGIAVTPRDIDIQADEVGAYAIERIFQAFVTRKVTFSSTVNIRSHFGALVIDAVKVEIMGAIQKHLSDGTWEEPVRVERYKRFVEIEDMHIPVLSLEYEYSAYLKMGRTKQANMVKDAIEGKL